MSIDAPTMAMMVAFMQVLCGVFLIGASLHYRDERAGYWWGASHIALSAGVALSIAGAITSTDWITACAFLVFLMCAAMQWHGTRLLTGAKTYWPLLLVGPALVGAVNFVPVGDALPAVRGVTATLLNAAYFSASVVALARPKTESLSAFKPLIILFFANIVAVGLAPFGGLGSTEGGLPSLFSLGGLIYLDGQIFVLGSTIFVALAMRERKELSSRNASLTDPLTGLPNRRSFFESAERLFTRSQTSGAPFSLMMIDLDNFKLINDRFGHSVGDQVLEEFASTARVVFRPNDALGRIGGEEFAVVLPGADIVGATAIANRVRRSFEVSGRFIDGNNVGATLSGGIVSSYPGATLDILMRDADAALYAAKQAGRNRVMTLDGELFEERSNVTHVA